MESIPALLHAEELKAVPSWPRHPWLRGGFSARLGGLSTVYGDAELNLGFTTEDDPDVVTSNRRHLLSEAAPGTGLDRLVTMRQIHGAVVRVVSASDAPFATADGRAVLECDGLATGEPGLVLGVMTADCVPILLADTRLRAVAALHAGWRGTLAGIAGEGIRTMQRAFGSRPEDIQAFLGPAILRCCFGIGDEVHDSFVRAYPYGGALFTRSESGQLHMDLHSANRRQLEEAGLLPSRIEAQPECTACTRLPSGRRKYFSHRAEKGVTGRMMSLIGVGVE